MAFAKSCFATTGQPPATIGPGKTGKKLPVLTIATA
jgi:hypothetical protein